MTDNDKATLKQFEEKFRRMLYEYRQTTELYKELSHKMEEKECLLKELQMRYDALETNYNNLKQAKIISLSDAEISTTKERLSKLVREIDRCIESLNKQG